KYQPKDSEDESRATIAIEQERQARLAAEKAEKERQARLAAEKAEKERQARLAAEKAEKERQARLAAEKAEKERIAAQKQKEINRLSWEHIRYTAQLASSPTRPRAESIVQHPNPLHGSPYMIPKTTSGESSVRKSLASTLPSERRDDSPSPDRASPPRSITSAHAFSSS
ncbi:hypothetical protein ADUPG1_011744, partial [Aduncisulcus paluster]